MIYVLYIDRIALRIISVKWTYLGQNKMANIMQMIFLNVFSLKRNLYSALNITKTVFQAPIYNKLALVQVMAWCRTGNKPLPESMLMQFFDTTCRMLE